jgi:hypothetical protein
MHKTENRCHAADYSETSQLTLTITVICCNLAYVEATVDINSV